MNDMINFSKVKPNQVSNSLIKTVKDSKSLVPILPLLFSFKGNPINLSTHFPFEPCFDLIRPRNLILRCGRQVGKSFQNALTVLMRGLTHQHWSVLYVTPLFEQVRRFSTLYLKRLIDESPARRLLTIKGEVNQVLQRNIGKSSTVFMSYAFRNSDRIRGTSANEVFYDEFQLFFEEVLPAIRQVMGGSPFGEYQSWAGSPLSFDNLLERTWRKSSMSEWLIPCRSCSYDNIAAAEYDLFKIIGDYHSDISPKQPGTVCAKCRKPIFTEDGMWWSRYPERWSEFRGLHLPQIIMPWHSTDASRWKELHNTLARNNEPEIYNEILGEACDSGFKPLTALELQKACNSDEKNELRAALIRRNNFTKVVMGIDWGGGGVSRLSRTKAAIIGMTPTGTTKVIYGVDMNMHFDPIKEAKALMMLASKFKVELIAHDAAGGLGNVSENILSSFNTMNCEIWPMTYTGTTAHGTYVKTQVDEQSGRMYFIVDRSRTIQFFFQAIKQLKVQFFEYDYINDDKPGLLQDFLSVEAVLSRTSVGKDVLLFNRSEAYSDDFLHACNFGCCALWGKYNAWPKLNKSLVGSLNQVANWSSSNGDVFTEEEIEAALKEVTMPDFGGYMPETF